MAIVGAGHNGLVAATLLGRAGRSVLILERREQVGGAAISGSPFPGVGARLSRYSYLVSLFPASLLRSLSVAVRLRVRAVSSYTPTGDSGLLVSNDREATRSSMTNVSGDPGAFDAWERFHAMLAGPARKVFPTLLQPLPSRQRLREHIADDAAWHALFEAPLSELLERSFQSDLIRGVVLTDALIGTFAPARDPALKQNRCFLYHVIGNGIGRWDVPEGGMGALTAALRRTAEAAGAEIRIGTEVTSLGTDGHTAELETDADRRFQARDVLVNAAPAVLARLRGDAQAERAEGSQLKINMLLSRLPRIKDPAVAPAQAFAGTFHVNEGYDQLDQAYLQANSGTIPTTPPCELYCHTLTDPSILAPELQAAGVHTLTLFGLHMPARLFAGPDQGARQRAKDSATEATLRSLDSVLAEPLEDCLLQSPDGSPCIEVLTPLELEAQLAMPGGHIFHRDLVWPFAENEQEVGTWGAQTEDPNIWLCGAGARRGGGVSGIPGHNAAQAVLEQRLSSSHRRGSTRASPRRG